MPACASEFDVRLDISAPMTTGSGGTSTARLNPRLLTQWSREVKVLTYPAGKPKAETHLNCNLGPRNKSEMKEI